MSEQARKKNFDETANSTQRWLRSADELLLAADRLHETHDDAISGKCDPRYLTVLYQALMLQGFAVEVLLKGLYVQSGKTMGDGGKLTGDMPTDHNLLAMWELSGERALTPDETSVLKRLVDVCTSLGRYPIARNYQKEVVYRETNGRFDWNSGFTQVLHSLIAELRTRLATPSPPRAPRQR